MTNIEKFNHFSVLISKTVYSILRSGPYKNVPNCTSAGIAFVAMKQHFLYYRREQCLVIKRKVAQNVTRMSENNISVCQNVNMSVCRYVRMSIFQNANFQLRYQKKSCSECQNDVRKHYVGMSTWQYVNMSECNFSD